MLITDNIFHIDGAVNDRSNLIQFDADCSYSLFLENQRDFMALRKSFSKF